MSYVNISIDSGLYSSDYEYRVNPNTSQNSTHVIYQLYHVPGSSFAAVGHNIKVQLSNNTWYDADASMHPDIIVDNGTTVTGTRTDNTHQNPLFVFTKPSSVLANSTGTEGVAVPQGSIARTSLTNVRVVIDKNSPSSSATVSYSVQVNGVSYGPGINHTQSSTDDFVTNLTFVTGTWKLWYQESGSGDQLLAERDYSNSKRRVHCNFW